jgi:acyl carrier protein
MSWQELRDWLLPLQRDRKTIAKVREMLLRRPQFDSKRFAREYFSEEKQTIARKLWEITRKHSVADITGMAPEDEFVADLKMDDLDSMSVIEFVIQLEKEFNINIPEGRTKAIRTFKELVDEIWRLQNRNKK